MSASQHVRLHEMQSIFNLLGEIGDLGADSTSWRTHALHGLVRLVEGQVAMTADVAGVGIGMPYPIDPIDIGWTDANVRQTYHNYFLNEIVDDPGANALFAQHGRTRFLTAVREQMIDDQCWYSSKAVSELRRFGGVDDFVVSTLNWCPGWIQGFIIYRPWGAPRFGLRQRRLMRLMHLGLLRLYRKRLQESHRSSIAELPPRLMQTFDLLMHGASVKEIAGKLEISKHTANDHMKALYHRLVVSSRSMLVSKYISYLSSPIIALPTGMTPPP